MQPELNLVGKQQESFHEQYNYKIAVYLLSHAIELLFKSLISFHNLNFKSNHLKSPTKYSHNVIDMVNDLISVGLITLDEKDYEIFKLVDEYLKWFGRYYSPHTRDIPDVIKQAYTEPDENGLINFKYKLKYPDTHRDLERIYQEHILEIAQPLDFHYLLHSP